MTTETTTDLFEAPDIPRQLALFSPADSAIAVMRDEYMPLTIAGLDDAAGYRRVHAARMIVKDRRIQIEKKRKELKADALEYGRKVDGEAKRLTALLEPIETHLLQEEKAIDDEKERIRNEARLKAEAEEQARREAEAARIKAEQDAENERLRAEREKLEAERKAREAEWEAERQKIEVEKARVAAEQKAAQDRIDAEREAMEAERKRIADAEAARLRAIEMEKAKAEAAEKARVETEKRVAREAAEKAAREKAKAEAAERKRLRAEAMRSDREKLLSVANAVFAIVLPDVSDEAEDARLAVAEVLAEARTSIHQIVEGME